MSPSPSDQPTRRRRPSAAVIVASLALVVAAAPPAYAALAANSVGSRQIVNGSVTAADIRANTVNSGRVTNSSLGLGDFADSARWRKTLTGAYNYSPGVVTQVAVFPATTSLGSLSADGTGVLRVSRTSRVLVDGSVLAQNQSGVTKKIDCNVVIGDSVRNPDSTALLLNGSSTTLAVSASTSVRPGTYDVSVTCYAASAGMTAGNAHVNVVAVPLM